MILPACLTCKHGYIEEVSYEYFTRVDGRTMAVPVDEKPPVIMCGRDPHRIKSCLGRCEDYEDVYGEDEEE